MSEKGVNYKFLAVIIGLMLAVSVLVLMIDLSLKASILAEALKFREDVNAALSRDERPVDIGDTDDAGMDNDIPSDLLDSDTTGMAPASASRDDEVPASPPPGKRTKPRAIAGNPEIQAGN